MEQRPEITESRVPDGEGALLSALAPRLLSWYDACARSLPWRESRDPYRVWVSEIMLQQTRVETVKPYYTRFLEAFPTAADLAAAPEERLLKLWEGLGYYSRARNLQKGARAVVEQFGGVVPSSVEELRSLPGVGDYTAGAVASIAFGVPVPAVDGNVLRVFSRFLACREDVSAPAAKKRVEKELSAVLPQDRPGDFNQALMDLGATVCLPGGAPRCGSCPLRDLCRARALGLEGELPVKGAKVSRKVEERTVFLLTCGGKLALRRRPEKGLLAGLWELPSAPGSLEEGEALRTLREQGVEVESLERLPGAKHVFTHLEWHMTGWAGKAEFPAPCFSWAAEGELRNEYALPSAFKAYVPLIWERLGSGDAGPKTLSK